MLEHCVQYSEDESQCASEEEAMEFWSNFDMIFVQVGYQQLDMDNFKEPLSMMNSF